LSSTLFVANIGLRNTIQDWASRHHVTMPAVIALEGLKAKAQTGDPEAQFQLSLCFSIPSLGAKLDLKEALEWLSRAEGQGHVAAQGHLALACFLISGSSQIRPRG
jgi:TPR repeat protein